MPKHADSSTTTTYARSSSADNLPVSVTYSGTTGFRYLSCRPDEYLLKTGLGVPQEQAVGKKTCDPLCTRARRPRRHHDVCRVLTVHRWVSRRAREARTNPEVGPTLPPMHSAHAHMRMLVPRVVVASRLAPVTHPCSRARALAASNGPSSVSPRSRWRRATSPSRSTASPKTSFLSSSRSSSRSGPSIPRWTSSASWCTRAR